MFTVNVYENVKTPRISHNTSTDEILNQIKLGNPFTLEIINSIRKLGKDDSLYQKEKCNLPCVTWNFLYQDRKIDKNIKAATGLIYLDVDGSTEFDISNPYIYACWKSISNTGLGIIVKVNGLSQDNFSITYSEISTMLGLPTDKGARKASQFNVISYDPNIYINENSETYLAKEISNKKGIIASKQEKSDTNIEEYIKLRFNNFDEFFVGEYSDVEYRYFKDKVKVIDPFFPQLIEEGERNKYMFWYVSQIANLNPKAGVGILKKIANRVNFNFVVRYSEDKINSIVNSIVKKREEGSLEAFYNKERKLIYNPKFAKQRKEKSRKEKQISSSKLLGKLITENTKQDIYDIIEDWDFDSNGKITQSKVAQLSGKSLITIKRNWDDFKNFVSELNSDFKQLDKKVSSLVNERERSTYTTNDTLFENNDFYSDDWQEEDYSNTNNLPLMTPREAFDLQIKDLKTIEIKDNEIIDYQVSPEHLEQGNDFKSYHEDNYMTKAIDDLLKKYRLKNG